MRKINRRQAVAGISSTLLLPAAACTSSPSWPTANPVFAHGVASGDPDDTSVVLWTRVTTGDRSAEGTWAVSSDARFSDIVAVGSFATDARRDFTVKVLATGLEPGHQFYYRFEHNGTQSTIGQTRTLPIGHVERLGIAVASCSNYPFGYFNAYEAIADDPVIDFVLHLGDYLYEYGPDGYGGETGRSLGRIHEPRHEIVSLADYRLRHAQYKADLQSQAMHAAHPLICIWDDHESTNNPWMQGAENHQPDTEGPWVPRRASSLQAYFEWMPVRDPASESDRAYYWRHFRFGDLASLVTLETRHTGRAEQVVYSAHLAGIGDHTDAARFQRDVLHAPGRYMLGSDMESFLSRSLRECNANARRWRLIGNQIPIARTHVPDLDDPWFEAREYDPNDPVEQELAYLARLGQLDLPIYLDTWDGYPVARERFYRTCKGAGVSDLLVLTGDSHAFWQNELFDRDGRPMGLELGTSGITSPGDFVGFGEEGARIIDERLAEHNREVHWTDCRHNGYVRLQLDHDEGRADYVWVTDILSRDYDIETIRSARILSEGGTLRYA